MNKFMDCGAGLRPILGAVAVIASLIVSCATAFGSQAVAFQIDPAHTGSQSGNLTPPLVQRWSRDLGNSFSTISYPLIVEGKVFVLVDNGNSYGTNLYALDQATGATVWGPFQDTSATYSFAGLTYDAGRVFVLNYDGILRAFDASSGAMVWQTYLGGEYPDHRVLWSFTSPPTAVAGTIYLSGAGFGAKMLAVSAQDGTLKWSTAINGGEHSSPAVSASGVYVTYANAASSAFSPTTGELLWKYSAPGGGGGRTPVLFNNRLYARDTASGGHIILDASTGAKIGGVDVGVYPKPPAPAFSGSMGYFSGTIHYGLKAIDTTTLATIWSFNGDSPINTPPIVVNGYVYVATYNGTLYALDANTGAAVRIANLGAKMLGPDENNAEMLTGFAAADDLLVVSAGNRLIAFQSAPPAPPPAPTIELSSSSYSVREEEGRLNVTVTRNTSSVPATVDYATSDSGQLINCNVANGLASSRCDYATSKGTLRFGVGELDKTISIPLVDDNFAEGNETFNLTLSNPTGAPFGSNTKAVITIIDNLNTPVHPLFYTEFFVRQHYIDFLGREPDPVGYQGWINILDRCRTTDNSCDRIEVSSGFFRSEEFQNRGYFIYRFYSSVGKIPLYEQFITDLAKVSGFLSAQELENNKVAFVSEFMARSDYQTKYGEITDNTAYVDALLSTVGLPSHPGRQGWINALNSGASRAVVLRQVVESAEVYTKYYNEAFVIMQYFGYLRRDADISYLQWIQTMSQTGGDYRTMINGFLNSAEYRQRFGN